MIKMTSNSRKTVQNSLEDMAEQKQGYLTGQNRLERRMIDIDKSKRAQKYVVTAGREDGRGCIDRMNPNKSELAELNRLMATGTGILGVNRAMRRALKSLSKKVKH